MWVEEAAMFLRSHSRVTPGPGTEGGRRKKKKSTILNAGGWKSATLEEVKEALLAFRPHVP